MTSHGHCCAIFQFLAGTKIKCLELTMANKVWYTVAEASQILGKSERTIRRQIQEKKLTSRRIKGVVSVYLNTANLPKDETVLHNEQPLEDIPQDGHSKEKDMSGDEKEREKDLEIAKLIKDLDKANTDIDWLKRGYEQLQATHYLTVSALNEIKLQLSPPRGEKTAEGEIIGLDTKSTPQGIVDAKKAKILNDVTQILVVVVLIGVLVAVALLIGDYITP